MNYASYIKLVLWIFLAPCFVIVSVNAILDLRSFAWKPYIFDQDYNNIARNLANSDEGLKLENINDRLFKRKLAQQSQSDCAVTGSSL